jgi:Piezo non-specific cation channel, R-Ras-binding domain
MFGKTTEIWYEEMPRPELVLIIIDAIQMARIEEDFLKENFLY